MAVSTITLESSNGDSVVVSAPNDDYLVDDIILDTDPKGMYDTGFKVAPCRARSRSAAVLSASRSRSASLCCRSG
jgi:hypothetical protein